VGRYVVEAVEDEAPALTPEEEAGIEAALESYRQGRVVDANGCHLTSAGISGQYNCRLSTPLPFADPKAPGAPITTPNASGQGERAAREAGEK
jgi:hypothetical protein